MCGNEGSHCYGFTPNHIIPLNKVPYILNNQYVQNVNAFLIFNENALILRKFVKTSNFLLLRMAFNILCF